MGVWAESGPAVATSRALFGVPRHFLLWSVGGGILSGVVYTLSPLTVWFAAVVIVTLQLAGRGLPSDERRWLFGLLLAGLALRCLAVGILFLSSEHDHQATGILFGDEAYAHERALRIRNILLGLPASKYDYVHAFDEYGRSSYLYLLAYVHLLFGPSPYGMRLLNSALFITGVLLLFRLTGRAFGALPAFGGLVVLLFLPTLFFWSISLLKESLYFVLTATVLVAAIACVRAPAWSARIAAALAVVAGLWALHDLRTGAVVMTGLGLALGFTARFMTGSVRRFCGTAILALLAALLLFRQPAVRQRVMAGLETAARVHAGHVFTAGHAYKLLDDWFYLKPRDPEAHLALTPDEAARFAARSLLAFIVVPLPWQIGTTGELAYLPEQIVWYLLVLLVPVGAIAAFRRDPLVVCLLVGYVLPTAASVAITSGNIGTLIRHRALVTPYLVWLAAVGLSVTIRRLSSSACRSEHAPHRAEEARG